MSKEITYYKSLGQLIMHEFIKNNIDSSISDRSKMIKIIDNILADYIKKDEANKIGLKKAIEILEEKLGE